MTAEPKLREKNIGYTLETAEKIHCSHQNIRAGSSDEDSVKDYFKDCLKNYCDDTTEQLFHSHPGVGTVTEKILSAALIFCALMFFVSVKTGEVIPSALSSLLNIGAFVLFAYKFIFDGTKFNFVAPKKLSSNICGKRFSRETAKQRVVLVSHLDAPLSLRFSLLGNQTPYILSICSVIGNTLLFCSNLLFLFSGAPFNSKFFTVLSVFSLIFIPVYVFSLIVVNPGKTSSGISASLVPSALILSILKQFSEDSFRYSKTELCCLFTGSEHSSHAGSYAFAKKHKRLFGDMPTYFIPIDEITSSDKLAVFFKDLNGNKGSTQIASVIAQAADNLNLTVNKEAMVLGTSSFTPFCENHFPACSLGTSKKLTSKSLSPTDDKITAIRRKTIGDVGALIIETLNYYDS